MLVSAYLKTVPGGVDVTVREVSGRIALEWRTKEETELAILSLALGEVLGKRWAVAPTRLNLLWQRLGASPDGSVASIEVTVVVNEDGLEECFICGGPCHDADAAPFAPLACEENCSRCFPCFLCGQCRVRLPSGWCCFSCLEQGDLKHLSLAAVARLKEVDFETWVELNTSRANSSASASATTITSTNTSTSTYTSVRDCEQENAPRMMDLAGRPLAH